MYACLAVTCHLHFWQNDRDFLRATVVTRGWNGYRNKSQHRKSTLEKKILPPFQQGFEPATFQSRVRCSNHWAIPAPRLVNCLWHFKYKLGRKALEIMYKSLILPLFDYAEIIWDNCTNTQSNILENLHLEAIRIITGSVRGATNPYHRRRPYERIIPSFRTEIYRNSFFPSTALLWNNLSVNIQESSSLSEFKRYLTNNNTKVPSYYYSGKRMEQIIDCRLRLEMSDVNFDLFNRHLTENQSCACGHPFETAEHFLLLRPNYHHIRRDTIMLIEDNYLDIQILLFSNQSLGTIKTNSYFKKYTTLYDEHGVSSIWPTAKTHTHATNLQCVCSNKKRNSHSMLPLLGLKLVHMPLSLSPCTHTHSHTQPHAHTRAHTTTRTHTGACTGTNRRAHMHTRARTR